MTADQLELVKDAFPTDDAGETRCGHCGEKRKATLALCWHCWRRLSAFIQAEILRSANLVEKAHLIVQTRPASVARGDERASIRALRNTTGTAGES